ncbi:c2h2 finger domain-containing protein [Rutstroemia sp. NJR-2017a BBW]|nr:c2h2 finger domain-containing protein [Rutstroemia sp. NJR-2017a BBW]
MTSTFPMRPMSDIPDQDSYRGSVSSFPLYSDGSAPFTGYSAQHALPLLRIPEDPLMPGLSYTQDNSPWCSSASESTYSTHSDSSHIGRMGSRGRSGSLVTAPEWSAVPVSGAHWSSHGMTAAPQDLRSPPYETGMEVYETSYTPPRMSPPTRQLLDVPVGNYYMESVASSPRVSDARLASYDRRSKELVDNQQLGILTNIGIVMAIPTRSTMASIDQYLSAYWENFDKLYPIIHRATFTHDHDSLLSFAMAAIGTQYCYNIEARKHGVELHAYCIKTIPLALNWTLQTLQAILLTEIFIRFRGKRTTVRLSRQFIETYNRLLNIPCQIHESESIAGDNLMDSLDTTQDAESEWLQWVDTESRRRLLCFCFIFDIHQAMCHQQSRAKSYSDAINTILYVPCPEFMWEATSAADWGANRHGNHSNQPLQLAQQYIPQENLSELSYFTQTLHICALVSQLPNHDDPNDAKNTQSHDVQLQIRTLQTLFPASPTLCTYLALYHTPLHDLLAVTGDTWVFSSKLKHPSLFREAQMRLRIWSSSPAAATAVHYACRFLEFALSNPQRASTDARNVVDHLDLSHYWSLYVTALICWAFGHRVGENTIARFHNDLRPVTDTVIDNPSHEASEKTRLKALVYAKSMLRLDKADLLSNKAMMRAQSLYVVDAVRARLQFESVGDHCMMLVDCIGVLKRLREKGRGKLF